MGFENLRYDFPEMPKEIRAMIETEVEKQVKTEPMQWKSKRTMKRTIAASFAAILLCGTTVFAGANIYRMQQQKIGDHGIQIDIAENSTEGKTAQEKESVEIPNVKMETGYLPEGMVKREEGKYSFENALDLGGVTMIFYRMDTGDDAFELQKGDVLSSEDFTLNGHQGVYLEYPHLYQDEITFNQRVYVSFPEVHYVMEMYAASDVSKDDAIKIAGNVKLIPAKDTEKELFVAAQDWSSFQENLDKNTDVEFCETITSVAKEEMKNTHALGEDFSVGDEGLAAKVVDVKVSDDIHLLNDALLDDDLKNEVDENGKLRPATIQYIKDGGMDSLSQEVSSRTAPQKLVYTTIEYTNTSKEEKKDILFFGNLVRIDEVGGQMQMVTEEKPAEQEEWDRAVNHGLSAFEEMLYYDVHGGERGNNYIERLGAGETATVHMAWVVMEDELGKLYLSLDPSGGSEFTESSLDIGYVDIRQ